MSACQAGLQRHPSYLSARVTLGRALQELGENAAASKEFEYVLSIAPDNLLAIRGLAELREASRGAAQPVHPARVIESRPKEQQVSEPFALKSPVAERLEAEPAFVEPAVADSEFNESQFAEPRFGELQFVDPQFNEADFAEAQLVESLIVEPHVNDQGVAESDEAASGFAGRDADDAVWELAAPDQSDESASDSHEPAEIGAFRRWFDREEPDLDPQDLAMSRSMDAAIDAAIEAANETSIEPSRPVDQPIYGPAEPTINPVIEAVIDRAHRAQRAAQIERLEIWLQRLEELRRDISGQHDA